MDRPALAVSLALTAVLCPSTSASAQVSDARVAAESAWHDLEASARRLAVARAEQRIALLTREERAEEALALIESVSDDGIARDRDSLGRLIDAARRLDPPQSEPAWMWAGIPIAALGVAGAVVAPVAIALTSRCSAGCIERDPGPWISAFALAGTAFVTGAVLIVVGLVRHVFAPERRRFLERRRDVVRALADARAGAGVTW